MWEARAITPWLIRYVECALVQNIHAYPHELSETRQRASCSFHSTKEPYRLVHCAHQERPWRKPRVPLLQNMPRNSPMRCASTVTSTHDRADSLRIAYLGVQRRMPRRDTEGVHGDLATTHTQIPRSGWVGSRSRVEQRPGD